MDFFWILLVLEFLGGKVGLLCDSIFSDIGWRVILCDCGTIYVVLGYDISGKRGKKRLPYRLSALLTLEHARVWSMYEYWGVRGGCKGGGRFYEVGVFTVHFFLLWGIEKNVLNITFLSSAVFPSVQSVLTYVRDGRPGPTVFSSDKV